MKYNILYRSKAALRRKHVSHNSVIWGNGWSLEIHSPGTRSEAEAEVQRLSLREPGFTFILVPADGKETRSQYLLP